MRSDVAFVDAPVGHCEIFGLRSDREGKSWKGGVLGCHRQIRIDSLSAARRINWRRAKVEAGSLV